MRLQLPSTDSAPSWLLRSLRPFQRSYAVADINPSMAGPRIVHVGPGVGAQAHLLACRVARVLTRLFTRDRGLWQAVNVLARVFGERHYARVEVFGGRQLRVNLADAYWMTPILKSAVYEPEVFFVLDTFLHPDDLFLDCGANIGWWSLFAATRIPTAGRIVAIEASPSMFASLLETSELNGNPFTAINAAVWEEGGKELVLRSRKTNAAGGSVKKNAQPNYREERTISLALEDILRTAEGYPPPRRIVLKLDVEGAEAEALRGAGESLREIDLLVYEDHGKEREAYVTAAVLGAGFSVFFCDDSLNVREVRELATARAMKRNASRGYNFVACWPDSAAFMELSALTR